MRKIERMGKRTFFVTLLIFLVTGFIYSQEILQENQGREYRIGAKDLLEISVFGLDEMSQTVRVSEKGKITLPLLGEIEVEELTKAELERKLGQLLEKKYLQNPQVTVFIREYQSKKVYVLGAVGKPGSYKLLGRQTVLQLISDAGGLIEDAGDEIIVIRQHKNGSSKTLRILIDDLILKGDARLNIPLEPNDIVNIPVDKTVFIYVFGQVRKPGALNVKKLNIPTLLQAIAQAGGFSERASKRGVLIKRIDKDGKEQEIKVNVKDIIKGKKKDIQLKENDVVYVPETIF
jgi:polysaccharide export outer membrane protein